MLVGNNRVYRELGYTLYYYLLELVMVWATLPSSLLSCLPVARCFDDDERQVYADRCTCLPDTHRVAQKPGGQPGCFDIRCAVEHQLVCVHIILYNIHIIYISYRGEL